MNLLNDPWIPVQFQDGSAGTIRPAELTARIQKNPAVRLAAPRADFNGALLQFLIGLVQTTMTPEDEWHEHFESTPPSELLEEKFAPFQDYFNLHGDGPRFMQDLELNEGTQVSISGLFIDSPGENAIKHNTDHFIKRGNTQRICAACAATALHTLQTNAPSGGVGHRTSLRGGGPLTTVLVPDRNNPKENTLWHSVWLNILNAESLRATNCNPEKTSPEDIFPWMAPTRTSEEKGGAVLPSDVSPLQTLWGMPRRIRLDEPVQDSADCDLCGTEATLLYTSYTTRNYGIEYGDGFLHPLSPYYLDKDTLRPYHPQPGGFSYRHWPEFVLSGSTGKSGERALVIKAALQRQWEDESVGLAAKIHRFLVFGYDMDNMKARCWYETEMPIISPPQIGSELFTVLAQGMAEVARQFASFSRKCIKDAWFDAKHSVRGDLGFVDLEFYSATEEIYFSALNSLVRKEMTSPEQANPDMKRWLAGLQSTALALFDTHVDDSAYQHGDPERIVNARKSLRSLSSWNKIREPLFLPAITKKTEKSND